MSSQIEANINKFIESNDRARRLIQMDANGELNKYSNKRNIDNKQVPHESYITESQTPTAYAKNFKNSKLPKEIINSFKEQPIEMGQSVLGDKIIEKITKNNSTSIVEETKKTTPTNSNIDYSLIKSIIDESIRKYTVAIQKKVLNESKQNNQLSIMKIGNKLNFISSNGDVYEANLKFIKNINDKKTETN